MADIRKYMKSRFIEYYETPCGNTTYFDRLFFTYTSFLVCWDYNTPDIKELEHRRTLFERWCKRFGYKIHSEKCYDNVVTYSVVSIHDDKVMNDFRYYLTLAVDAGNRYRHDHGYDADLNDKLDVIRRSWEQLAIDWFNYKYNWNIA